MSSGLTILRIGHADRSLGVALSLSILPLPDTGLLETTQSTEAASVVNPIPGPHQTSGTATQLDDNDNGADEDDDDEGLLFWTELLQPMDTPPPTLTAELRDLFLLLFCFFFLTLLGSQSAEVLITAGTDTCGDAVQPSPLNVAKFFFLVEKTVEAVGVVEFSWVGLVGENGARSRDEMVGLMEREEEEEEIGSISWVSCWFCVLGFLYLICSETVELSENTTGIVALHSKDERRQQWRIQDLGL